VQWASLRADEGSEAEDLCDPEGRGHAACKMPQETDVVLAPGRREVGPREVPEFRPTLAYRLPEN
jgi:hypothetical protein